MAKKILLIDDDDDDRELFCEAMQQVAAEIECVTASTGKKALSMLASPEFEIPDIIFLDVNMPMVSGWQCLLMLKEKEAYKDIPVIMYSTSSNGEDINKALQLGALCFYIKPLDYKYWKRDLGTVVRHLNADTLSSLTTNLSQGTAYDD